MAISFKPAALALDMGTIKVNYQAACSPNISVTTFWWLTLPCPPLSHCLLFRCRVVAQPSCPSPGPCPSASRPCWAPQPVAWEQACSVRQARTAKEVSMKDNRANAAPLSGADSQLTCTSSLCGNAILALYLLLTWQQGYHTHSKRLSRRTVSIL